jgi:hypothetical protein
MVVNNLDDPNGGHATLVNIAGRQNRHRPNVRRENEPSRTTKIEGVLSSTIPREPMGTTRGPTDLRERRRRSKDRQSPLDDRPLLVAEAADASTVGFAGFGQLAIGPGDVNLTTPLTQ